MDKCTPQPQTTFLQTANYMCTPQQLNYSKHGFPLHVKVNLRGLTRFTFFKCFLTVLLHINHLSQFKQIEGYLRRIELQK